MINSKFIPNIIHKKKFVAEGVKTLPYNRYARVIYPKTKHRAHKPLILATHPDVKKQYKVLNNKIGLYHEHICRQAITFESEYQKNEIIALLQLNNYHKKAD